MRNAIIAILFWVGFSVPSALAWGGFFREQGVRDSLAELAQSFESRDIDGLRRRMAEEFLLGNPEITGRLQNAFEQFDKIKLLYKVASIQVVEGIASVRLDWTKTCTDRMSNWTYRDIGKNVVLHFSAVPPYQLVGLEDANLFGVSFLLQARIIMTAPALAKLELDRKKLELEERRLALEESRAEKERLREAQTQLRVRAQAEIRTHNERMESAAETSAPPVDATQTVAAVATPAPPKLSLWAVAPVKMPASPGAHELAADQVEGHPVHTHPVRQPIAPEQSRPLSQIAASLIDSYASTRAVLPPEPSAATPGKSPEEIVADIELAQTVREKAEAEALALLSRRRQAVDSVVPVPQPIVIPPPMGPVESPPELEAWRRETLKELQVLPPTMTHATSMPVGIAVDPLLTSVGMAEARRRAAERARLLAEKDEAAEGVLSDIRRRAAERSEVLSNAPTAAIEYPALSKANLREIEETARLKSEVREKADAEALQLLQARGRVQPRDVATVPVAKSDMPVAALSENQLAASVRENADREARRLLAVRADAQQASIDASNAVIDDLLTPETNQDAAPVPNSTDRQLPDENSSALEIIEVIVSDPERGMIKEPEPGADKTGIVPASVQREALLPDLCEIKGGRQPDGPDYDFYLSRFEISNQEFCRFLNDVKKTMSVWSGAPACFDSDGNMFMNDARQAQHKLFSMSNLDFGGRQTGILFENGDYVPVPGREDHPVIGVSWFGALKYCNWLTVASGLGEPNICYSEGSKPSEWHPINLTSREWNDGFSAEERRAWLEACVGYRLPMNEFNSAAGPYNEFYLAAAWNNQRNVVFGFGRDSISGADANYMDSNYPPENGTTPVGFYDGTDHDGLFQTNPNQNYYSVYDLSGNVWEWSSDTTGNSDYRALYGGSWRSDTDSVKSMYRGSISPHNTADHVGFRLVVGQRPGGD